MAKKELSLPDVARLLRVSEPTLRRLERSGTIPMARRKSNKRVYNEEEYWQLYYHFYEPLLEQCKIDA